MFSSFVDVFACLLASISWSHQARSHPCSCPQGSSIKHQQEHRSRAEALRLGILCQWQPPSIAQLPHSHESHRTSKSQKTRTQKRQKNASYLSAIDTSQESSSIQFASICYSKDPIPVETKSLGFLGSRL